MLILEITFIGACWKDMELMLSVPRVINYGFCGLETSKLNFNKVINTYFGLAYMQIALSGPIFGTYDHSEPAQALGEAPRCFP